MAHKSYAIVLLLLLLLLFCLRAGERNAIETKSSFFLSLSLNGKTGDFFYKITIGGGGGGGHSKRAAREVEGGICLLLFCKKKKKKKNVFSD